MDQRTPLYDQHLNHKARMAPFAGWAMPIQYQGIVEEHGYTRHAASIFDTSHMGEFELSGPTAEADLERLLTQRIRTIQPYQCRYGFLLNPDGGVRDDLTCYRLGDDRFYLVVNAGTCAADAEWIQAHCAPQTRFEDRSAATAKLDIQGPKSRRMLEQILGTALPDLKFFRACDWTLDGMPCLLSRTGYTGEWGYEIYFPADEAERVWQRLTASGDIRPAGLGARDTLRMEVGYPLYGHELGPDRTPAAATGGAFMDLDKPFIGAEAVRDALAAGPTERLVGLVLEGRRAARAGDTVWDGAEHVGTITSGSFAPSLGVAAAMAYVEHTHAQPGHRLEIECRGKRLAAEVRALPLYRQGTAREVS